MATISVDFDGVLHTYEHGWQDGSIYGKLMPGARKALQRLMKGYSVFVLTTRNPDQAADWLEEETSIPCTTINSGTFWNEGGKILVTNQKLPALVYVDDRAMKFVDWPSTLEEIKRNY